VTHHSDDDEYGDEGAASLRNPEAALRAFRILKDADGLDRVRFSGLDQSYLRLAPSPARADRAHALLEALPDPSPDDLADLVAHDTCLAFDDED
jgi:hypothetical protein